MGLLAREGCGDLMSDDTPKDVFSFNELSALTRLLDRVNEFLVDWEDEDLDIPGLIMEVRDKSGLLVGSLTRYPKHDVQYEPGFSSGLFVE